MSWRWKRNVTGNIFLDAIKEHKQQTTFDLASVMSSFMMLQYGCKHKFELDVTGSTVAVPNIVE